MRVTQNVTIEKQAETEQQQDGTNQDVGVENPDNFYHDVLRCEFTELHNCEQRGIQRTARLYSDDYLDSMDGYADGSDRDAKGKEKGKDNDAKESKGFEGNLSIKYQGPAPSFQTDVKIKAPGCSLNVDKDGHDSDGSDSDHGGGVSSDSADSRD